MGDLREITTAERNVLHKVDSGGIRFRVRVPLPGLGPAITFTAKNKPFLELYKIIIGRQTKVIDLTISNDIESDSVRRYPLEQMDFQQFQEFWITWYNKKIKMGVSEEKKPFLVYPMCTTFDIGFIQFNTMSRSWAPVEWVIETSPVVLKTLSCKTFEDRLRWVSMDSPRLPSDALVGGYENELIYIARAHHNNSLCPGKYVPSTGLAYVPWGSREHAKNDFEILCGYNALWVKTEANQIPVNAFVGGRSEIHNEALYIGRAMHEGKLITGKVHVRYKTCYLPYNGKEIEVGSYEILVVPQDDIPQALPFVT